MKASNHNILEFILSKKVILVEGCAEYMLIDKMFQLKTNKKANESDVTIISVDGISFKRYLNIAKILSLKTAVIRDNDKDYQKNCVDNYKDYFGDKIKIFSDKDNSKHTFEISIYMNNKDICEKLFASERKSLTVQDYMLKNKSDAAFALMESDNELVVPDYINEAIVWINE